MQDYLSILIFILTGLIIGVLPMLAGKVLGPHNPSAAKLSAYECGFDAFSDARSKFNIRYYLVAILFILFDLEMIFLFPWATVLKEVGLFGFGAVVIFLAILTIGFIYEWKRGALEWQ